jgi:hypothetical protein
MITVAKMADGRVVQVVRVADTVGFSPEPGWVMVCFDFEKTYSKRAEFKWMPASTRFEWVREWHESREGSSSSTHRPRPA